MTRPEQVFGVADRCQCGQEIIVPLTLSFDPSKWSRVLRVAVPCSSCGARSLYAVPAEQDTPVERCPDRAWEDGRRSLARRLIRDLMMEVGEHEAELTEVRLRLELSEARSVLRRLCEDHGDNDWSDDLYLADALDKHLGRYLDE